mmetsp:Transcript_18174/g.43840  ORF Transcript_18174/g.43840 Transcript_18174/m.43840 type:complete len:220 (-) Transcript_18174:5075-5734(-)
MEPYDAAPSNVTPSHGPTVPGALKMGVGVAGSAGRSTRTAPAIASEFSKQMCASSPERHTARSRRFSGSHSRSSLIRTVAPKPSVMSSSCVVRNVHCASSGFAANVATVPSSKTTPHGITPDLLALFVCSWNDTYTCPPESENCDLTTVGGYACATIGHGLPTPHVVPLVPPMTSPWNMITISYSPGICAVYVTCSPADDTSPTTPSDTIVVAPPDVYW